jgi:3-hydroxyisobutyrate dehydrogenase-like beta-hydroxyacid dehydrogenase
MTVGLLYPGEMGAALACALRDTARVRRVVTIMSGRSAQTARRAADAGIVGLDSPTNVARESDLVLSVVPPAAAEDVADAWCRIADVAPRHGIYADVNSVSPELAVAIGARVATTGHEFVDVAINGLAKTLRSAGTMYVSGKRADVVTSLFAGAMRVVNLGAEPGRASAMKMLLSGVSKGVCGLFMELAAVARQRGLYDELMRALEQIYPNVAALAERMLPTYPQHAARRAAEMRELEQTARASDVQPPVLGAVRELHEMLAATQFGQERWTAASIVARVANELRSEMKV